MNMNIRKEDAEKMNLKEFIELVNCSRLEDGIKIIQTKNYFVITWK